MEIVEAAAKGMVQGLQLDEDINGHPLMYNTEATIVDTISPWQVTAITSLIFFVMEVMCMRLLPALSPTVRSLDKRKQRDFVERVISHIHAIVLIFASTRVVYALKGHGSPLVFLLFSGSTSLPADIDLHVPDLWRLGLLYQSFSVGYFIWDLSTCIRDYRRLGLAFTIHASAGVLALGYPVVFTPNAAGSIPNSHLLVYYACAIFLFEISTPFLNLRAWLFVFGYESSLLYLINNLAFALAFTLSRVLFGVPLCFSMIYWIYHQHYPLFPAALYIIAPLASALLNVTWFRGIIQAVMRGGEVKRKNT